MAIRFTHVLYSAALIGATTLVTSQVISQDDHKHPHGEHDHAHGEQAVDMDEMMKAWMETAQPGAEHAEMIKGEGKWSVTQKHWMYPGAEPETYTSKATMKPIMGGRFLMEHVTGEMEIMGEMHDFKGMGIFGFDNITKKHTFIWLDNMSTMMMIAEGEKNDDGDIVYMSTMPDPMTGETKEVKSVSRVVDDNKHLFMMYGKGPDGEWFMNAEITATRQ